ncbi:MAG: MMPL family transporter [Polyangiaceae bacterium]
MTGFALRYRQFTVLAWLALLVLSLGVVAVRLSSRDAVVDNSVGIWFQKDDPGLKVYEDFNRQFGQKEWSILLLRADSVFEPPFLHDLAQITARLEKVEHVTKVISLTNVRDSEASGDGALTYSRLYPATNSDGLLTEAEAASFKARLYRNPVFERSILRRDDSSATVLLFQNDNFINDPAPYRIQMVDAVKKVLDAYPRVRGYSLAGTSVINAELNRASQHDGIRFYILATLFIIGATYVSLRNWRDLLIVLSVVTAGALPPMAALAALRIPYNMVTVMLPPILITLSVCDVVHVINAFHFERRGLAPAPAIVKAIDGIWTPCMWTSIVTAIGFLSLAMSTVFPIWQMGVFAAMGIGLAWLMTMTYVPVALVSLWPRGRTGENEGADGAKPVGLYARRLLPLQVGAWRWVWLSVAGAMALTSFGIGRLQVDTNYTKFFGEDMYVTRAYPQIAQAGYGQSPVTLMVRFPAGTSYATGDHFARILRFEDEIRREPSVIKLMTFTDLLERADLAFSGEAGAAGRLKGYNPQQLEQLYLMSEIGGNDDLRDFVTDDKSTLQFVAMAPYMSSKELQSFKERVYKAGAATLPSDAELSVTGTTVQWANMDKEISQTQMYSLYIIAAVFLVLLPIIFRSFMLGIIGVVINSLPMAITFGLMGLMNIKINIATALLGGVAIGATVDSTIFFVNRVRLGREERLPWLEAVNQSVLMVGDGIIMTAFILVGGFSCLATSSFLPTSNFGALVTVSIAVAVFMDIVVNPVVLRLVGGVGAAATARVAVDGGAARPFIVE